MQYTKEERRNYTAEITFTKGQNKFVSISFNLLINVLEEILALCTTFSGDRERELMKKLLVIK